MALGRVTLLIALAGVATAARTSRGALRMAASGASAVSFDRAALAASLRTRASGRRVEYFEETDSTMLRASALLAELGGREAHGALVVTDWQTNGVGRRGRNWESGRGQNLLFSMVWSPPALSEAPPADVIAHMVQLNLAVSVAVVRACEHVGVTTAKVKWPNDVWALDRKLAGSLVNFNGERAAVVGIGINVNEQSADAGVSDGERLGEAGTWPSTVVQRVSVRELLGSAEPVAREPVLAHVCNALESLMDLSPESFLDQYRRVDMLIGRSVRVHHARREVNDPRDYDGTVVDITKQGFLRVRHAGGDATLSGEEISITPRLGSW
jgi:BirA family biotin operon repressor/biotin-[acetyl-CoA-carboxylase] ligase